MFTLKDKLGRSFSNGVWMQVRDEEELSFVIQELLDRKFKGNLVSVERVTQKPSGEDRLLMIFKLVDDPERSCLNPLGWTYYEEHRKWEEAKKALTSRRNKIRYEEKKRRLASS